MNGAGAREPMEVDVLFVGAGPASLSGALRLLHLIERHNQTQSKKLENLQVVILEKGAELGAHILSGAVLDPIALSELVPDFLARGCPLEAPVAREAVYFLTESRKIQFPVIPPPMENHGNYVCTLGKLVQWLGKQVEQKGGYILTEVAGKEFLEENGRIAGVITGEKGIDKQGHPKSNYEPGMAIRAKAVVLGEGPLGTLTRKAVHRFHLQEGKFPQAYATSVKEIWEVPSGRCPEGTVIHTMGYPLRNDMFGGGFLYGLRDNLVSLGLVVALDYKDPYFDTQAVFQAYKEHPLIRDILEGGKIQRYGAKIIPEGGYFSIPKLTFPNGVIIGDSAGFVNVPKLKGIHYGMKSGMLAADAIYQCLAEENFSGEKLAQYEKKVYESYIGRDLYKTRHFKGVFQGNFGLGFLQFGLQMLLGGWWYTKGSPHADFQGMARVREYYPTPILPPERKFDETLTFKKLTDVYYSGTKHEENQPVHLLVNHFRFSETDLCGTRCAEEYGNPCQYFCPASVYEMVKDSRGNPALQINAANCVHCKTCDVKDPYGVIEWVSPEGGGGPFYLQM